MKKISIYLIMLACAMLVVSCSQNEVYENIAETQIIEDAIEVSKKNAVIMSDENVIVVSEEGLEPESVVQNLVEEYPEHYNFVDSNSQLWIEENNNGFGILASPPLTASGYDVKTQIGTATTVMFSQGLACDSRVFPYVYYVAKKYQYKKTIQIPHNATLILPRKSIMEAMVPMGIEPGKTTYGYSYELVSTGSTYDTYYLVTEGNEITHNVSGQQVAPANNPIYFPCNLRVPNDFLFKYQYSEVDW